MALMPFESLTSVSSWQFSLSHLVLMRMSYQRTVPSWPHEVNACGSLATVRISKQVRSLWHENLLALALDDVSSMSLKNISPFAEHETICLSFEFGRNFALNMFAR